MKFQCTKVSLKNKKKTQGASSESPYFFTPLEYRTPDLSSISPIMNSSNGALWRPPVDYSSSAHMDPLS